jgi:hypothetical protein
MDPHHYCYTAVCLDAPSAIKMHLALEIADAIAKTHPELLQDLIRVEWRNSPLINDRMTCGPAFAAAALLLGLIE